LNRRSTCSTRFPLLTMDLHRRLLRYSSSMDSSSRVGKERNSFVYQVLQRFDSPRLACLRHSGLVA
jgi:hypothetical protein